MTAWACDAVAGRFVVGDLVRHAAERHLKDLREGGSRGLVWSAAQALRDINFFPSCLTITGGMRVGQPFHLLPYTLFLAGQIYGWRLHESGLRRFRTVWIETGKGQAKSPFMAAIGLKEMRFAGVPRAEVLAFAETREQADVLFQDAVAMARAPIPGEPDEDGLAPPTLERAAGLKLRGTGKATWQIEWDGSEAGLGICSFRPIASGDAMSGPKPVLVLGDEIHEHKTDDAIELQAAALAKMSGDPLMILGTNTPAANQVVGATYSGYYADVARGAYPDDSSLAFIARTDKGDDPLEDETCWAKSLPALGITYEVEKIRAEVQKAKALPSKAVKVKRLFFGIQIGAADSWIDEAAWENVQGRFDESQLDRLPLNLSLDLSSRQDLTALGKGWEHPDGILVSVRYWTPRDTMVARAREDKTPYDVWAEQGELTAVPGMVIDKYFVAQEVKALHARGNVRALFFDPAQIQDFEAAAREVGLDTWLYEGPDKPAGNGLMMVRHGQGFRGMGSATSLWMPSSVEATEDAILKAELLVQDSPVTRSCSMNMTFDRDFADNRSPSKKRSRGRIDGMTALIMAVGGAKAKLKVKQPRRAGLTLL